jgi:SsrA-binding protein
MLIANETVAQHFYWMELPFVYRTHDNPDAEKIDKLATFIRNFGYYIKSQQEEIHPKELQKLLTKVEDTPEEALISRLTLRSMKQAKYTTECTGHFGLACQYYCHFTSPIRRYPDLQIHRIIKEQLRGKLSAKRIDHYNEILPEVAKHSSDMERRADEAERETDKLKKVEYMEGHIGEIFEGVISSITSWGVYVELPNTIEGMIHVSMLPGDYFYYDEESYEMVGQATDIRYKLGQTLKVRVNGTDKISRTIDFVIPNEWEIGKKDEFMGKNEPQKLIANNKKAYHDFFIEEKYECGIALHGTEVKSLRMGKCSIKEAFIRIENGEVFIYGMHISPYEKGNIFNKDPLRVKKLLMHKQEINKLLGKIKEKGYTLVPLQVYFSNGKAKVEIGLAKGKKLYDKRDDIAKKDARREAEREFKVRQL